MDFKNENKNKILIDYSMPETRQMELDRQF